MKGIILTFFAALVTLKILYENIISSTTPLSSDSSSEIPQLFQLWKKKFEKTYSSTEEEAYRLQVFTSNFAFIQSYNSQGNSDTLGLNKFADLTNEEFNAQKSKVSLEAGSICKGPQYNSPSPPPATFDWTEQGVVPIVSSTGQCAANWAFASVYAADSYYAIANSNQLTYFSIQQVIDCDRANQGCDGGFPENALYYIAVNGLETESDYPYNDQQSECKYNSNLAVKIFDNCTSIAPNNSNALQVAAANTPVIVLVDGSSTAFQLYQGGVISKNCATQVDSVVLVVGHSSVDGFEAWKVQNFWGSDWGEDGYAFIDVGNSEGPGVCGIYIQPSAPSPAQQEII